MRKLNLSKLEARLRQSWSEKTAYKGIWSPDNPTLNQCAVTALLVQDFYGGEIVKSPVGRSWHYYNLINGEEIDLTMEQFNNKSVAPDKSQKTFVSRENLLKSVKDRYQILRNCF